MTSATMSSAPVIQETTTSAVPSTSTTASTAALSETASPEAELTDAVRSFWDLYLDLGAQPGPFDPIAVRSRLEERTTGDELIQLFNVFQGHSLAGRIIRGEIESSTTVLTATDTRAEVRDCYDDTTGLYDVDSGERLDTDNPERHQVVFVLVFEDDTWKVSEVRDEGSGCVVAS